MMVRGKVRYRLCFYPPRSKPNGRVAKMLGRRLGKRFIGKVGRVRFICLFASTHRNSTLVWLDMGYGYGKG